ncbi:hypothetical protein BC937DRAFT_90430 [Endogone sp. FLAS-F59071]|nr:hypothetical protein BC937DRAFT_90430 [Endogone sp. FLAS-F59071]|eukprot:RUS22099.1 hypothetical protein BC937DRAFT_90430 [Endogone sp. FLAS-F59071]
MFGSLRRSILNTYPHSYTAIRTFTASTMTSKQQFLLVAWDYTDADAPTRRMAVRPDHLAGAAADKKTGMIISGGAILDSHVNGKMIGSSMIFQGDSEQEIRDRIARDPYVTGKVWEKWELFPYRE